MAEVGYDPGFKFHDVICKRALPPSFELISNGEFGEAVNMEYLFRKVGNNKEGEGYEGRQQFSSDIKGLSNTEISVDKNNDTDSLINSSEDVWNKFQLREKGLCLVTEQDITRIVYQWNVKDVKIMEDMANNVKAWYYI